MIDFEFRSAGRLRFGDGVVRELGDAARAYGERALIVTGRDAARTESIVSALPLRCARLAITGEPTVDVVAEALAQAREVDVVIAIGGGSAIDAGKAIAALATHGGEPLDYLEVIGRGHPLTKDSLPFIAVPTTAGTGAEVTKNAVLTSPAHGVKVSLRAPTMLPTLALVDPVLTHSMPPDVTAATGLDAFTQVLEPFVSVRSNPITDALCREAIVRGARSLRRACEDGRNADARRDMALVSVCGGLALANAGLGAVHGIAGPLGGMVDAPHGAICARLLPRVVEANVAALRVRDPGSRALARYAEVATIVAGDPSTDALIDWLDALVEALAIPRLRTYGLRESDLDALTERSLRASSMKGNPVALTQAELLEVVARAI